MTTPDTGEEHEGHRRNQAPRKHARVRDAARLIVAVIAALASVYWLSRYADLRAIPPLIQSSHRSALIGAVALLLVSLFARSLRWHALLPSGSPLSRVEAFRIFHVSILLNNLLPFRAGDSLRVLSPAVRRSVSTRHAILILVVERTMDAVALLLVAGVVLPMAGPKLLARLPNPGSVLGIALALIALTAAAIAVAAAASPLVRIRLRGLKLVAREALQRAMTAERPRAQSILIWTLLAWIGTFWLHYLLFDAVGIRGTLLLAIVVTLSTNFSMLVPATPANIGVFHAAAAAPLLAMGMPADLSVTYAILVHAVNTLPPILVGTACLAVSFARPRLTSMFARTPA